MQFGSCTAHLVDNAGETIQVSVVVKCNQTPAKQKMNRSSEMTNYAGCSTALADHQKFSRLPVYSKECNFQEGQILTFLSPTNSFSISDPVVRTYFNEKRTELMYNPTNRESDNPHTRSEGLLLQHLYDDDPDMS